MKAKNRLLVLLAIIVTVFLTFLATSYLFSLQSEYKLTDTFTVEAEKELKQENIPDAKDKTTANEKVLLKYKKSFYEEVRYGSREDRREIQMQYLRQ